MGRGRDLPSPFRRGAGGEGRLRIFIYFRFSTPFSQWNQWNNELVNNSPDFQFTRRRVFVRQELVSGPSVLPIPGAAKRPFLCNSAKHLSFVASCSGVASLRNSISAKRLRRAAASQVGVCPAEGCCTNDGGEQETAHAPSTGMVRWQPEASTERGHRSQAGNLRIRHTPCAVRRIGRSANDAKTAHGVCLIHLGP
jgi:hypothetical protein